MKRAREISSNCDFFMAVGIYGEMDPAIELLELAKENKAFTVEISPSHTLISEEVDEFILSNTSNSLISLIESLKTEIF